MASSVEELLREAQHAFQNISPGSADEEKYSARAKRLAHRIIRKSPDSIEGTQARMILFRLGDGPLISPTRNSVHRPHAGVTEHTPHPARSESGDATFVTQAFAAVASATQEHSSNGASDDDSWSSIWRLFSDLSYNKKKIVVVVLGAALLFIGFTPFLLLFFAFYFVQPALIRNHIRKLLVALG